MRGSLVVLALAITPFVAKVSRAQDTASTSSSTKNVCVKDPGNPSPSGDANRTKKCPTPPPPPPPGTVTISGTVFFDLPPYNGIFDSPDENGIAGWDVILTGPTFQTTYNTATDPDHPGTFIFVGVPSNATYTLCVQPSSQWVQTSPSSGPTCIGTFGNTFGYTIVAGSTDISNQNFGFYISSNF